MADKTKIEWTDATWNVVSGCTVYSPGCTNCYAMKQAHRFPPRQGLTVKTNGGMVWTGEVRFNEAVLTQPLRWKRPRRIFVCAHGDLFHESVPDEWIDRVFAVMALCPQHQFQVLTKRSARMRDYLTTCPDSLRRRAWQSAAPSNLGYSESHLFCQWPLPNVWLGVSVEDQQRADERVPDLLATPAAVRWLSCEPLLGPVDLVHRPFPESHYEDWLRGHAWDDVNGDLTWDIWGAEHGPKLDWIVVGGESGPKARPMHPDWARSLRDQCEAAGVPFLFKQWGEFHPSNHGPMDCSAAGAMLVALEGGARIAEGADLRTGEEPMCKLGKKRAGRLLDGVEHNGFPQVAHG